MFAVAALAKLLDRDGARQAVGDFGVPPSLVATVAVAVPVAELAVAIALLITPTAVAGAVGAIALLAVFVAGIAISLVRGRPPDCQCFGRIHSEIVSSKTIIRNAVLAAGAAVVVLDGPGTGLGAWSSGLNGMDFVALIVALALVVAFVFEGSKLIAKWRGSRRRGGTAIR